MTEGTENAVVEKTPEETAADEKESEAAFAAGVAKVRGSEPETPQQEADEEKGTTEAAAKATADTQDPWAAVPVVVREKLQKLDELPGQISKLAGYIGGFKRQLDSITATAKAAAEKTGTEAPSRVEIAEAMQDPEKWKQLKEDFPEWMAPVEEELTRLRKEVAAALKGIQAQPAAREQAAPIDTRKLLSEAEERAYVRLKHPDWKAICATKEFAYWLDAQPAELRAKAESDSGDDAVAVLDAYKMYRQKLAEEEAEKARKEKRLQGAIPAKGSPEPPSTGISDEEAFERGLRRVRGLK